MKKNNIRESLYAEKAALHEKISLINKEIHKVEFEDNLSKHQKFVGKCYRQVEKGDTDYVRCFYVYGISDDARELKTLEISYWKDKPDTYFSIDFYSLFRPYEKDDFDTYKTISRKEFDKHFIETKKRIELIVK